MITNQNIGQAVAAASQGKIISREGWNGQGMFVFQQVPSLVPEAIIPKMTSLPEAVKTVLIGRGGHITYQNQFALVKPDNSIHGWTPSSADTLATDWCIHGEFAVAGDTVGTASPL